MATSTFTQLLTSLARAPCLLLPLSGSHSGALVATCAYTVALVFSVKLYVVCWDDFQVINFARSTSDLLLCSVSHSTLQKYV